MVINAAALAEDSAERDRGVLDAGERHRLSVWAQRRLDMHRRCETHPEPGTGRRPPAHSPGATPIRPRRRSRERWRGQPTWPPPPPRHRRHSAGLAAAEMRHQPRRCQQRSETRAGNNPESAESSSRGHRPAARPHSRRHDPIVVDVEHITTNCRDPPARYQRRNAGKGGLSNNANGELRAWG